MTTLENNNTSAGVGGLVAFVQSLPLALPEAREHTMQRLKIKPWMVEVDHHGNTHSALLREWDFKHATLVQMWRDLKAVDLFNDAYPKDSRERNECYDFLRAIEWQDAKYSCIRKNGVEMLKECKATVSAWLADAAVEALDAAARKRREAKELKAYLKRDLAA